MTHNLISKYVDRNQKLWDEARASEERANKVKRDRDTKVGKDQADLDKRTSKVESLKI